MAEVPVRVAKRGNTDLETLVVGADGAGQLMVFLHGAGGAPEAYLPLLKFLAVHYNAQIWAPRLPNHGRSDDAVDYRRCHELLRIWASAHRLIGVPWVGHSIGAFIALELATNVDRKYRDLTSKVVALAPPVGPWFGWRPIRWLPLRLICAYEDAFVYALLGLVQALFNGTLRQFIAAWAQLYRQPLPRLRKMMRVIHDSPLINGDVVDAVKDASAAANPIQLLFGRWDVVVPPWNLQVPGAVRAIPCAGHNFPLVLSATVLRHIIAAMKRAGVGHVSAPDPFSETNPMT